jgi:hypothetical protein
MAAAEAEAASPLPWTSATTPLQPAEMAEEAAT